MNTPSQNTSTLPLSEVMAAAVRDQARSAGSESPAVRGSDWRLAVVSVVGTDGTITTADGIVARRLETYVSPAVSDLIVITQSGSGQWLAWGRGSTGGFAVGEVVGVRKSVSTSRASTTTITADPHLAITVVPGTYLVDSLIMYDADTAADLKLGWTAPASTTGAWWPCGSDSGNITLAATARWGATSDFTTTTLPVAGVGSGTIVACRPTGTAVVTASGTLSLAWAQQASSATPTVVRGQSWLQLRRIA